MPVGFAVAGPAAEAFGTRETLLAVAAAAVVLPGVLAGVPGVRRVRRLDARTAPAP